MKIAVVGDIGIDYYENPNLLKPGGIAFNFAYNVKMSGVKNVSLVGVLGSDKYSQKLLSLAKKMRFNTSNVQTIKGDCPKQNIYLGKGGERKFTGYNAGVLVKWKPRMKDLDSIKKHDAVFVPLSDGMEQIFNTVKKLKKPLKAVDFSQDSEFADFDKEENVITKNAKHFDTIFVGGKKKHQKMIKLLARKYPEKIFVLTLGKDGSISYYQGIKSFQPAKKINKVIDTTGCGDAFQAGFLSTWLTTKNINKSLTKGTQRAASVIRHAGSTPLTISTAETGIP